jgi:hypothetical protein
VGRIRRPAAGTLVALAFGALFVVGYPALSAASSQYSYGYGYQYQYTTGHLIVVKHVVNDNGGTRTAANFTITIGGVTATGGNSFPGSEAGTDKEVTPGSYTVTETGPSGYTASFGAGCSGTIAVGETKTCTITNNDQPGRIIVIKHVINDNKGKSKAADFTMKINGVTVLNGSSSFPGAESPGTSRDVNAGAYTVTETTPKQDLYWDFPSADCKGTVANGETKTCTIVNNDQAPPKNLTYWKGHPAPSLLPQPIGSYNVDTWPKADNVLGANNCGGTTGPALVSCVAAQLLVAELNVANASDRCIQPTIDKANAFLRGETISVWGIPGTGFVYTGPGGTYNPTAAQKTKLKDFKSALTGYNAGTDCQIL